MNVFTEIYSGLKKSQEQHRHQKSIEELQRHVLNIREQVVVTDEQVPIPEGLEPIAQRRFGWISGMSRNQYVCTERYFHVNGRIIVTDEHQGHNIHGEARTLPLRARVFQGFAYDQVGEYFFA